MDFPWHLPSGYLTVRHGIDGPFIDGLPFLKMGGSFHGELLVITRWYIIYHMLNNQMVYHNQRVTVSNGTLQ